METNVNVNNGTYEVTKLLAEAKHLQTVKKEFNDVADSQEVKGLEKYGVALDPHAKYDWLAMAKEELVDGFKYLECERVRRDELISVVIDDLEHLQLNWGTISQHALLIKCINNLKRMKGE